MRRPDHGVENRDSLPFKGKIDIGLVHGIITASELRPDVTVSGTLGEERSVSLRGVIVMWHILSSARCHGSVHPRPVIKLSKRHSGHTERRIARNLEGRPQEEQYGDIARWRGMWTKRPQNTTSYGASARSPSSSPGSNARRTPGVHGLLLTSSRSLQYETHATRAVIAPDAELDETSALQCNRVCKRGRVCLTS